MNHRVLVVDDDEATHEVGQTTLELVAGWQVDLAASGAETVRVATGNPPDAILLDIMMLSMDGPVTEARLQDGTRAREVPVVLLTAKAQPAERRPWEQLGLAGVFDKPFDPLGLSAEVADLLRWDR